MTRYSNDIVDQYGAPVVGAKIYVYTQDEQLATLTADGGGALANPVTSDQYGGFYFNTDDGLYTLAYYYGGKLILRDEAVMVGEGLPLPDSVITALGVSGGANYVGSDDDAGGSLWTTVAGFIARLRSSVGSAIVGFLNTGTDAQPRDLQSRGRDWLNATDFLPPGFVLDGSVDYTTYLQKALNQAIAGKRGLFLPAGRYLVSGIDGLVANATLGLGQQVHIRGDGVTNTQIINANGSALSVGGHFVHVSDLVLYSEGGAACLKCTALLAVSRFSNLQLVQTADNVGVFDNGGFEFVDIWFTDFFFQHTLTSTVPAFKVVTPGGYANDVVFRNGRVQDCGTKHFFHIENTGGNYQYAWTWDTVNFQVCVGGGIRMAGVNGWTFWNLQNWDVDLGPGSECVNDFYLLETTGDGFPSLNGEAGQLLRLGGAMASGKVDLRLPPSGGGTGTNIGNCGAFRSAPDTFKIEANGAGFTFTGRADHVTITGGGAQMGFTTNTGMANAFTGYAVGGTKVVGARGAAVPDASGGATVDAEARAAINALLARVRAHGLIS